ncbi:MAG: cysteine protease StiP family protein [Lachnospiraceae bacterium]|nr:cysteine protease StiP family protein [Lachnospiraceae bacterium]
MKSSYKNDDVILLLKDITGMVEPQPTEERERLIQQGRHYCEMLPIEYVPTEKYMQVYREALEKYSSVTAQAVGRLADKIIKARGENVVLVSLARAGIPIGILLKRYIKKKYGLDVMHYSISIIRGMGIDDNAMKYLLAHHKAEDLLFVDGWIGKGAILNELRKDISAYDGVSSEIAVVADPANVTKLYGTSEDILIPSSCLNCTVSGLVSRTFYRTDIIGKDDFHGAIYYGEMEENDLSYEFINAIEEKFEIQEDFKNQESFKDESTTIKNSAQEYVKAEGFGIDEVRKIGEHFGIDDINLIKPGIGETTRVLLRRVPWKVLIDERYRNDDSLAHIVRLADEKGVPIEYYPLMHYKTCGIIKKIADA